MEKKYGLIIPGKGEKKAPVANFSRPSIFGSDSDSDGEQSSGKVGLLGPGDSQKRQARLIQEKALKEDPTVFQYDELYDEIESKKQEAKLKAKSAEEKKPKYIKKLLETAEKRKKDYERRIERQVQKEREEEGEKFKDKEAFVTSAYKKKLEEMRLAEQEEEREAYLESIGDVTKQKDLDGFYRHLYEQKLGKEKVEDADEEKAVGEGIKTPEKISKKERRYRKRKNSAEEADQVDSDDAPVVKKAHHIQSNIDADSDFSIDSSSESEDDQDEKKISEKEHVKENTSSADVKAPEEQKQSIPESTEKPLPETEKPTPEIKPEEKKPKPKAEKKPKVNIWAKRTVGAVLEAALQRYYERKAARTGG